jgi:SAM-dependent methyltransferase
MAPTGAAVAAAYDAIAADYDDHLRAGEAMRRRLRQRYARLFRPGMRVLDVGCGTGIDAIFLAGRGVQVVAIDIAPGMVAELRRKVRQAGVAGLVETQVMDVAAVDAWLPASFDGIISAFAGLNTVADLGNFGQQAARLLRPGGRLVAHLLSPWSVWDILPLLRRGQFGAIAGRMRQRQRTVVIGGVPVVHRLYSPREAMGGLSGGDMRLVHGEAFGILTAPDGRDAPPFLAAGLDRLERRAGGWYPLRNGGRFFLLELEKSACPLTVGSPPARSKPGAS